MDLPTGLLIITAVCALLIGISKTALPTLGIFVVAVMATIFPARESIGIVLPMLIAADLVAVFYYRRSVDWPTLFRLLPWVSGGLAVGFFFLFTMESGRAIEIALGLIITAMVVLQVRNMRKAPTTKADYSKLFLIVIGTLAGFTTMIGNAAGPVMAIFLLAAGLQKQAFIGTGAWFFLTVNLIKVPLYTSLGLITASSLTLNAMMLPFILLGTWAGIRLIRLIPQKLFSVLILILALAGGLRLLLGA
ncbi:sulfite exporter TauE/SafE family protein [Alkalicoccus luteus]|uniref:Probable membrane transporter protein n=1 Tax=Alkalicoccus luteus TaxID=1237094 RepID=A0A969TVK1_9BACI|nr:sulfite exporter TauE/SafE family protein [Alkalicoccus luteus]NJP38091.1 sulfite exporter TauE/SafE family protein [Alkalicoccus luteus]